MPGTPIRRRVLKGYTRSLGYLALVLQAGACNVSRNAKPLDGCYYLGEEPILKIQGTRGVLLVPGDVSRFQLMPQVSSDYMWMTTLPNFVIVGKHRKYVKSIGKLPSPVIVIEDDGSTSRIYVHDNGETARLARQDSCSTE